MLDVRRLRVLQAVAEHGSFSAAADALSFTQSAVSQQIAALERETGTTLIQRGPRGIRLTDAGRALLAHTEAVLDRLADAERELAAIAGLCGGRVRMASFPSAGATLVTRAVSVFRERHPDVELSLTEAEPDVSVPLLRRGEVELALGYDYGVTEGVASVDLNDGLSCIQLFDDPLHLVLPAEHRLAGRKSIKLEELADDPWVGGVRAGHCHEMVLHWCRVAGFKPCVAFESNDHSVLVGLVAAGVGVALLSELAIRTVQADVAIRPVAVHAPYRQVLAAVPAEGYRSPAVDAMVEVLESVAGEFRGAGRAAAGGGRLPTSVS
jgi:DNA-binding transcriptional LysR family regulator